jgi:hypothetical protein
MESPTGIMATEQPVPPARLGDAINGMYWVAESPAGAAGGAGLSSASRTEPNDKTSVSKMTGLLLLPTATVMASSRVVPARKGLFWLPNGQRQALPTDVHK